MRNPLAIPLTLAIAAFATTALVLYVDAVASFV